MKITLRVVVFVTVLAWGASDALAAVGPGPQPNPNGPGVTLGR
jgi:hypothetical protein